MANVISPTGVSGVIPDAQLDRALKQGYKLRLSDGSAAEESTGKALAEGAFRGATAGFGDQALADIESGFNMVTDPEASTGQQLERMAARRKTNSTAATVGEIGGALATSLATGGGASALVGGGVKGAAFEGGIWGLGNLVTESSLENTPLTAERIGANILGGALLSGGVAGGFKLIGMGVSAAGSKFAGSSLQDTLRTAADKAEWGGLSQSNKVWARNNEGLKKDILGLARKLNISALSDDALATVTTHADDVGSQIGASMDDLERQIPLKGNDKLRSELIVSIEKRLEPLARDPNYREGIASMQKDLQQLAGDVELSWQDVWKYQQGLYKQLPSNGAASNASKEVIEKTRDALRTHVFDDVAERVSNGSGASMRKLGKDYAVAKGLEEGLTNRVASIEASGGPLGFSGVRSLFGAAAGGAVGGIPGAVVGSIGEQQLTKRGGFIASKVLRGLADSPTVAGVGGQLKSRISTILSVAPDILGAYRYPLAQAGAQGADALLQAHVQLASGPNGQDYMSKLGLTAESHEEVAAAGHRIAVLDGLHANALEFDQNIARGVDGLLGASPGRKSGVSAPMSMKDFKATGDRLDELMRDPSAAFASVPPEMRAGAPALSAQAAAQVMKTAQFLKSKMPADPNAALPKALATQWQPSAEALDKFGRYKEAVENPARVLKNMANGFLSPEQNEALQAVYPALYQDLRQKLSERLMAHNKPLTYQQRLAFSTILGPQALGMTTQMAQVIQQSQALAPDKQNGQSGPKQDGRQKVDQEKNIQTQAQRLEAR